MKYFCLNTLSFFFLGCLFTFVFVMFRSTPQRQHPVHPGSVPGYHHPPDMRRSPYQGHGYPARPQYPHQQPGYPVPPQQGPSSGPPNQANLKRPGQDISGQPPNKYPRPVSVCVDGLILCSCVFVLLLIFVLFCRREWQAIISRVI